MFDIYILDCYNVKLNTGTLPDDVRWSSFRPELSVGSKYLSSRGEKHNLKSNLDKKHKLKSRTVFFNFHIGHLNN